MTQSAQAKIWNESVGEAWATHADHFDATLSPFGEAVIDRLGVGAGDRVVDVGCGTGATTLRLASSAAPARVLGVDVSSPMLAMARRRATAAGVSNVNFSEADVEAAPFGAGVFDVAFSRFGVMFFTDPVRAFTHVREALIEGGRLGFSCFQAPSENPFITVPTMAAASSLALAPPAGPTAPGPFSMADPERTAAILGSAGFGDISIEPGPTSAVLGAAGDLIALARRLLEQNPSTAPVLAIADPSVREAAIAAAAAALEPHVADGRVTLGAGTWIVTAAAR